MSAVEKVQQQALAWSEICARHPGEWVCLIDVENADDGSIRSASVISHDRSMRQALTHIGRLQQDTVVAHTSGHPLYTPRMEMTDEIRDIIRTRR